MVADYFENLKKYNGEWDDGCVRAHMFKFLHAGMEGENDLKKELGCTKGLDQIRAFAQKVADLRKGKKPSEKLGWYYRHWKGMNLDKDECSTYSTEKWDI